MENIKILIIEDNVVTLGALEIRIAEMGYENIKTAVTGEEAIEVAHHFQPDIILSDINLGKGISGIEAVKLIQEKQEIPVIYLTAYDDDKTIQEANNTEPYAYLVKPLQEQELKTALSIALYKQRTRQKIKDSEELFKAITLQAKDAIILVDSEDIVKFWNQSAEKIFGYKEEEIIGKTLHDLIIPDRYKEIQKKAFAFFKSTGEGTYLNKTVELSGIRKNKEEFPIEISLKSLYIKNKLHAVGIVRDITARKQAERILEQKNKELKEANATKDRFISILGHDLRSPFNALLGFTDLLSMNIENYDKAEIKKFIDLIKESANQTFNLLNNLLDWSRCQRNQIPFNPQKTSVYYLVHVTYMQISHIAMEKKIDINLEIAKELMVLVDSEMIKTVIRNLMSNAIKYTSEGGSIHVSANEKYNFVEIEISDTGIGMTEKVKNSLFRIDQIKSQKGTNGEAGTGFGLLLCKEFIEKHRGKISIESELGKGSRFTIALPVQQEMDGN